MRGKHPGPPGHEHRSSGFRSRGAKEKAPESYDSGAIKRVPPSSYSPTGKPGSTIADVRLNFRVRHGNGCGPHSIDGGKTVVVQVARWQPNSFLGPNGHLSSLLRVSRPFVLIGQALNTTLLVHQQPSSYEFAKQTRGPICSKQREALRRANGRGQASRAISTGQLHTLLRFHLLPINVLVSDGPSGDRSPGEISS